MQTTTTETTKTPRLHLAILTPRMAPGGKVLAPTRSTLCGKGKDARMTTEDVQVTCPRCLEGMQAEQAFQALETTPLDICEHQRVIRNMDRFFSYRCLGCDMLLTAGSLPQDAEIVDADSDIAQEAEAMQVEPDAQAEPEREEPETEREEEQEEGMQEDPTICVTSMCVSEVSCDHALHCEHHCDCPVEAARPFYEGTQGVALSPAYLDQLRTEMHSMLAAEAPYPSSVGSQAIYADIDRAAERTRGEEAFGAEVDYLLSLMQGANSRALLLEALQHKAVRVRIPSATGRAAQEARPFTGGRGKKVCGQVPAEVQAQMRADRAAGMSYAKIDAKYGYPVEKKGHYSYVVCKVAS